MSAAQLRPTFSFESPLSEEELIRRIRTSFSIQEDEHAEKADTRSSSEYHGRFARGHAMIAINESKRHFWSPWMHLEIRQEEDHRIVEGRFSPHPSIWTGVIFSFLAIACLSFFAVILGMSQQLMGQTPWAYGLILVGICAAVSLWFFSKTGQKLAQEEMEEMRSRIERSLR